MTDVKGRYGLLWRQYRREVERQEGGVNNLVRLDYWVGRRAFEDGRSRKEIVLMLVAGSATAREIFERQGKAQAMNYVRKSAIAICHNRGSQVQRIRQRRIELE